MWPNVKKLWHRNAHNLSTVTRTATERLIISLVTSRLDNLNSLLYGVDDYLLSKLQLVQNNSACVICNLRKSDHISSTLKDLHRFPVKSRILYNILLTVFKSQHGLAPRYLTDLLTPIYPNQISAIQLPAPSDYFKNQPHYVWRLCICSLCSQRME